MEIKLQQFQVFHPVILLLSDLPQIRFISLSSSSTILCHQVFFGFQSFTFPNDVHLKALLCILMGTMLVQIHFFLSVNKFSLGNSIRYLRFLSISFDISNILWFCFYGKKFIKSLNINKHLFINILSKKDPPHCVYISKIHFIYKLQS